MSAPFSSVVTIGLAACLLAGCGGNNTPSKVASPGLPEAVETRLLEGGAALLQARPPVAALNAYLDGFHFYSGNMQVQMEAHHYCSYVNEEVIQCVIYDGNVHDAKLMGIEYILSKRLFETLPAKEKSLWHSHVHEVKSGQLIAPGIPPLAEDALMQKLVGTYGKTFHTWHTDQHHALPLGVPQLVMGFTADGQAEPSMVAERDQRFGIDSAEKKSRRAGWPQPTISDGADAWQRGTVVQLADPTAEHGHARLPMQGAAPQTASPPPR